MRYENKKLSQGGYVRAPIKDILTYCCQKVQTRQASDLKEALALQTSLLRMMENSS